MHSGLIFCLWAAFYVLAAGHTTLIRRSTQLGEIDGLLFETDHVKAEVYLGVPFAEPPVGSRRFKASETIDRWPSEPYNATYRRPWCIQFWYYDDHLEKREQNEDCLYLNIFVPYQSNFTPPFPVLVWIHGGSFQVGGSGLFPIRTTVKNLVAHGIVVVFINYRLGPIGFLSSLSADLPGNYGLDDQLTALRWVHGYIADFGGDPNVVTVGGESSGAASVSILAVSPLTVGLFHRAIARSGSALSPWAVRSVNTDLNSLHVIKMVNCLTANGTANFTCLQHTSLTQLKSAWKAIAIDDLNLVLLKGDHEPMNYNHPFMAHTYFTPVVDSYRGNDSIIPTYAKELMKRNARMPLMTGVTTGECTAYVLWLAYLGKHSIIFHDHGCLEKKERLNLRNIEFVVPSRQYANPEQVKQAVYKFYVESETMNDHFDYIQALINIAGDQNFVVPWWTEMSIYAEHGLDALGYKFAYSSKSLFRKHINSDVSNEGASHGFDIVYLFESLSVIDPRELLYDSELGDAAVTSNLARSTVSFVKYGHATVLNGNESVVWPRFDTRDSLILCFNVSNAVEKLQIEMTFFWTRTVEMIQALTLTNGYVFSTDKDDDRISQLFNFKTASYVLLVLCLALLCLFCTYYCCQCRQKSIKFIRANTRC